MPTYHDENENGNVTVRISTRPHVPPFSTIQCKTCFAFWAIYNELPEMIETADYKAHTRHLTNEHNIPPYGEGMQ